MASQGAPVRWTAPGGRWTEPDLHLFPQDGHRYEIVDGSLHVTPPPTDGLHEPVVRALVTTLRGAAPEGWWVCARVGIECGASNLIPDVTVLRPRSSGAIWRNPADVALVVEVETPESRRYDRLLKPALYADAGIPAYWRIEPGPALHIYRLGPHGDYPIERSIEGVELVKLDVPFPGARGTVDLVLGPWNRYQGLAKSFTRGGTDDHRWHCLTNRPTGTARLPGCSPIECTGPSPGTDHRRSPNGPPATSCGT